MKMHYIRCFKRQNTIQKFASHWNNDNIYGTKHCVLLHLNHSCRDKFTNKTLSKDYIVVYNWIKYKFNLKSIESISQWHWDISPSLFKQVSISCTLTCQTTKFTWSCETSDYLPLTNEFLIFYISCTYLFYYMK